MDLAPLQSVGGMFPKTPSRLASSSSSALRGGGDRENAGMTPGAGLVMRNGNGNGNAPLAPTTTGGKSRPNRAALGEITNRHNATTAASNATNTVTKPTRMGLGAAMPQPKTNTKAAAAPRTVRFTDLEDEPDTCTRRPRHESDWDTPLAVGVMFEEVERTIARAASAKAHYDACPAVPLDDASEWDPVYRGDENGSRDAEAEHQAASAAFSSDWVLDDNLLV